MSGLAVFSTPAVSATITKAVNPRGPADSAVVTGRSVAIRSVEGDPTIRFPPSLRRARCQCFRNKIEEKPVIGKLTALSFPIAFEAYRFQEISFS
jgi:hypothetical protein